MVLWKSLTDPEWEKRRLAALRKIHRPVQKTHRQVGKPRADQRRATEIQVFYRGADRKELQTILRDHGFRSTEGRLAMLSVLRSSHGPLSVPTVAVKCGARLDRVNVYRALEALANAAILNRTDLRQGGAHYEFNDHHHHHLTCTDCGTVKDVEACEFNKVATAALREISGFAKVNSHSFELFGTCTTCARK